MTPPAPDPNIDNLNQIAAEYHAAEETVKKIRVRLDALVQEMKKMGYSYSTLARETRLAQGTIQNIVAKEN